MRLPDSWSCKQVALLRNVYPSLNQKDILKLFPRYTWRSLQNIAHFLKIKRDCQIRNGNIENLFSGSNESLYWIGLIVADGSISNTGELKVDLCVNDHKYLKKLAVFLNTKTSIFPAYKSFRSKNGKGICRVKIKDHINGIILRDLLKINGIKTYNPVSIDFIKTKRGLISFFGGYVDGDGNICKRGYIHIDAHKNYEKFMYRLGDKLKSFGVVTEFSVLRYKDMCRLNISAYDSLGIKKSLLRMGLPIMKRKWDRISDVPRIKNYLLANKKLIFRLRSKGKTLNQICNRISYKSKGTLSSFIKNNTQAA